MTDRTDAIIEQLYRYVEEAVELRYGVADDPDGKLSVPDSEDGPGAFVNVLIRARRRADRVEELLKNAKRIRRRLLQKKKDAADALEDKRDRAFVEGQATRAEFSTGDERRASANLLSFEEKRAARLAERQLNAAEEVVDALNDMHWGLNGFRDDVRTILRSFTLESNLDR